MQDNCFYDCFEDSLHYTLHQSDRWIDQLLRNDVHQGSIVEHQPNLQSQNKEEPFSSYQRTEFQNNLPSSQGTQENQQIGQSKVKNKNKTDSHKIKAKIGCSCKKSQCLKMYCQCYSSNGYCKQGCSCVNCKNNYENRQKVEEAKNRKNLKSSKNSHQCQCKKSKCQKNYCECYNAGVSCGAHCKCTGCQNCSHDIVVEKLNQEVLNKL